MPTKFVWRTFECRHVRVSLAAAGTPNCRWQPSGRPADLWLDNLAIMAVEDDPSQKRVELESSTHMRSSISSVTLPRPSRRSSAE